MTNRITNIASKLIEDKSNNKNNQSKQQQKTEGRKEHKTDGTSNKALNMMVDLKEYIGNYIKWRWTKLSN